MADRPIIIIKRKGAHGEHHGGAWKVAYADFVTAMMALFIVLWMMNTSKQVQEAVSGYFKDPSGNSKQVGTNLAGAGENFTITKQNMSKLKEELQKSIRNVAELDKLKNQIEMTITAEGLRIELLETETGTFFELGSSTPTANGKELLVMLAQELGKLPNKISIEGHTDSKPFAKESSAKGGSMGGHQRSPSYGNWELSTDRANAARQLMQESGVRANQISQVRGFADQRLRKPDQPYDSSNRRISLIVQYLPKDDSAGTLEPETHPHSPLPRKEH